MRKEKSIMKKLMFIILLMAVAMMAKAQQPKSPLFFHNRWEYSQYLMEHPENMPLKATDVLRTDYTQKLDSVIGSDNFDWSRWKNTYSYENDLVVETSYEWQDQVWKPTVKSESDNASNTVTFYRWTDEAWEPSYKTTSQYLDCGEGNLLESIITEEYVNSEWVLSNYSTYEYDNSCQLLLNVNYSGLDFAGEWKPSSKYEYSYDANGQLVLELYSTIRNGNWRETEKDTLIYNDQHQCVSMLSRRKGGWGPMANQWMDAYRFDFEYEDGNLASELYYAATGWFGGDLSLDSKSEYAFDTKGNEILKTSSIYNGMDWIERDSYTNTFDLSVDAASVLGLASVWESTLGMGMGFVLDEEMPLNSKWLSCAIISSNLDTQFDLYCSGFTAVDEYQEEGMRTYSRQGSLVVELDQPADVVVYDLLGRVVAVKSQTMQCEFNLTAGLYIVSNGNVKVKAIVK